jgi:hypothetical protein
MHGQHLYQFITLLSLCRLLKTNLVVYFILNSVCQFICFVAGDKLAKGFGKGENSTVWG